jgi:hypothetical protein
MGCKIRGLIVAVSKDRPSDRESACHKHPCIARVMIIDVVECGAAIPTSLNVGDTVEMSFAYTLHKTRKIFPLMDTHYPGLKKGDRFFAIAEQRLKMGGGVTHTVYHYDVLKWK